MEMYKQFDKLPLEIRCGQSYYNSSNDTLVLDSNLHKLFATLYIKVPTFRFDIQDEISNHGY